LNYSIKANIFRFIGNYENALEFIRKAIALEPNISDYYSILADILFWNERYDKSINALEKAIELDPDVASYYSKLADILSWIKRNEEALVLIEKAIELEPRNIHFYMQKSSLLAYELKESTAALKVLEQAFELNQKESSLFKLYKLKTSILLSMNSSIDAIKVIQETRKLFPQKQLYPNL
jgi:tetratricopeptide (TPR) repeat protein